MTPPFSSKTLIEVLHRFPAARRYLVAYSGGLDSHVLLHALNILKSSLPASLLAIHIDHNISEQAEEWARHARSVCEGLGLAFRLIKVDASAPDGKSPEAWARQLRYRAFNKQTQAGDILLTAHHKDDQAETLLLQLLRGAGPKGLAAMPLHCHFGAGLHVRPLLGVRRQALHEYAVNHGLQWIEDDTNRDGRYDRNYLRHEVLPVLQKRWTGLAETFARAADNQAEAVRLMEALAEIDMQSCYQARYRSLDVSAVKDLSSPRRSNLLRYYIQHLRLPLPDKKNLTRILHDVVSSKYDASPCITWEGAEVRRYTKHILALAPLGRHNAAESVVWKPGTPCKIAGESLTAKTSMGDGIKKSCLKDAVKVAFRQGGETLKPAGRRHHCELKKLFQEAGIPPWQRDRIPLLFVKDKLVAVVGLWIDESVYAADNEEAWRISWSGLERIMRFNEAV